MARLVAFFLITSSFILHPSSLLSQGFSYQAVVRGSNNLPLPSQNVSFRFSILDAELGTVYTETQNTSTNALGMVNLVIGETDPVSFASINWGTGGHSLKVEMDPAGGTNYTLSETRSLQSIPYALFSGTSGSVAPGKLEITGDENQNYEEALFEVKRYDGQTVFAVYPDGVRIYVEDAPGKSRKGGFAVGGFDPTKGLTSEYLWVSPDSVRIYVAGEDDKGPKGGFAVGGFNPTKGQNPVFIRVTPDSTTIATSNQLKKVSIRNTDENYPLLDIDGSIKMGYDQSTTSGTISYDGTKFYTYEKSKSGSKSDDLKEFVVTGAPEVITESVTDITRNGVTITAMVISDGGSEIIARGICWGISAAPLLATGNSVTVDGGTGSFSAVTSELKGSTSYYARAFATNSKFTSYGEDVMFTTSEAVLPKVTTIGVSSITSTSAVSGGIITDDGAADITARGVCWNTTGNPGLADSFTTDGTGSGEFSSSLTSLQTNTTYFVRAYATNSVGTSYGEEFSFATSDLPVLSTNPVTTVTGTSATSGGYIFTGGELMILQRGVCWNTTGNPTLEDSFTENGSGSGTFVSNITGLTLGTTYFVRAYATNATGTAYGNEYFFTTLNVPAITTDAVSLVTGTSATCGGNISYNGGAVVTQRGFCWNTTGDPTTDDPFIQAGEGSGAFSAEITGLTIGTTYYARAFATNSIGTAYGNTQMFTTQNFAVVVTSEVTDITYTTALGGGNITSDGGALITQRGVCWNTTGSPTLSDSLTLDGSGAGIFTSKITGLAANNTYYVRAYAINSIGTTYGQEVSFATPTIVPPEPGLPVIGTVPVTTGTDGYHTGGYISSDGGTPVTHRGVCWSNSENPTIVDNYTTDGTGTGLFNSLIADLEGCGTPYYIRAYATNSLGTAYGNQVSVSSGLLPLVEVTTEITEITKSSAISGGTITSDGGCEITERGICWSRRPNPTVTDFKVVSGSGTGSFTDSLTGLYPNDTYYVRAYAINDRGTGYGPELSFTTEAGTLGLKIGQFHAGGYIFYLDETGDHGLVCAPEDNEPAIWGCEGMYIYGLSTDVGTGAANTAIILASCPEEGIAARICDNLELNGYTDWFLPSIDELQLMYQNLHLYSIGNFSIVSWERYWSSSVRYDLLPSLFFDFKNGFYGDDSRFFERSVRAARAF